MITEIIGVKTLVESNLPPSPVSIIAISIPFGIGFASLFWFINLSYGLQLFLTIVCWGAVIGLMELGVWLVSKAIKKKNKDKPKKRDPFAD